MKTVTLRRSATKDIFLSLETSTSQHHVGAGELNLVDWRLLGWESRDLIRRNNHILALLLSTTSLTTRTTSSSRRWRSTRSVSSSDSSSDTVGIGLAPGSDNLAVRPLVWIGWNLDIPDTDSAVHAAGGEDRGLDAERERPDTTLTVTTAALDLSTLGQIPEDDRAASISRSEDLAVGRALKSSDRVSVAVEDADALAGSDGPHTNSLVDLV